MSQGQPKPGMRRVSYIEENATYKALDIMAAAKDTNLSALVREATAEYLAKHDTDGDLRKIAQTLATNLSDDKSERMQDVVDEDTQRALAKVLGKLRKK
jgi:hypothetical protein